jgi:multidrug efflux system outer membrane protein
MSFQKTLNCRTFGLVSLTGLVLFAARVAKAAYFPQISLTADGGYQSSALTGLFAGPAGFWSIGGSAVQPVFEGGRIRNRVRFAEAQTQEATVF